MVPFCSQSPISSVRIPPYLPLSCKSFASEAVNLQEYSSTFSGKSISAAPSPLNPNFPLLRLHCCTSSSWSSSSSVEKDDPPSRIVFVKGLPQSTSEGSIKKAFLKFGQINRVKIVMDKRSKQPLGFAYIWFNCDESAQLAVKEMNGKFLDGRFVMVTIARPGSCKTRVKASPYKF